MLARGSKGLDVKELQQHLTELGYYKGKIDGIFGKLTEDAVLLFQGKNMPPKEADGVYGPKTQVKLREIVKKLHSFVLELDGFRTVEDAGHGGTDPGAVDGKNDDPIYTEEKKITLAVTMQLHKKLIAKGAKSVLTRDGDEYPSLAQRVAIAKAHKANAFISIHCNASATPQAEGIEVLYHPKCAKSKQFATFALEELVKVIPGVKVRGIVPRDNLFILNGNYKNVIPSILVEIGFITNPKEEKWLSISANQDKVAEAGAKATVRFKKGK